MAVLACISHHLTAEAPDKADMASLRLLAVLTVPSSTPPRAQAARASSWRSSHALRLATW